MSPNQASRQSACFSGEHSQIPPSLRVHAPEPPLGQGTHFTGASASLQSGKDSSQPSPPQIPTPSRNTGSSALVCTIILSQNKRVPETKHYPDDAQDEMNQLYAICIHLRDVCNKLPHRQEQEEKLAGLSYPILEAAKKSERISKGPKGRISFLQD